MNIGGDWDFQFGSDGRKNLTPFADSDSTIGTNRGSIRLVVRRLENEWHRLRPADFRKAARHPPDKLFRFNHARSEDEGRLLAAEDDGTDFEWLRFHCALSSRAAQTARGLPILLKSQQTQTNQVETVRVEHRESVSCVIDCPTVRSLAVGQSIT